MTTDQERREWYANLANRHPNEWHWSRAAAPFTRLRAQVLGINPPVPSEDSRIITADQLYEYAAQQGFSLLVTNEKYCCPTEESFAELGRAAYENLVSLGLADYEAEVWDCEKFAFSARDQMWGFNKKTPNHPPGALAIGVFIYTRWSSLNLHAIICAFIRGKDGIYMEFIEPQSGKVVKLWPEEISSCMGIWI